MVAQIQNMLAASGQCPFSLHNVNVNELCVVMLCPLMLLFNGAREYFFCPNEELTLIYKLVVEDVDIIFTRDKNLPLNSL